MLLKTFSNHCLTSQFRRKVSICFACLVLHVILLCHVVLLSCNDKFILVLLSRPQHAQEDFEEETMEDDEAELTLNKVEEEMMVRLVLTDQIPGCCFLPLGTYYCI